MVGSSSGPQGTWVFPGAGFVASAAAACFAEVMTLPVDTAKVRLQLQGKSPGAAKYSGLIGTLRTVAKEEGSSALWKGLEPGLHRQCLYGGLRISMYEPVRNAVLGKDFKGDPPLTSKIFAGLFTGALAIAIASPTDLVKVRMQAQGKLPPGVAPKYPSAMSAYSIILKEEGLAKMWTGLGPNMVRNATINAVELASYDQIKESLMKYAGFQDNVYCHLASGLGAGFLAVCVGSPVDVVKSRMMGSAPGTYKGTIDCFMKTFSNDGLLAFYSGFGPNFARLGSWNVIMFLTLEQLKQKVFMRYD